jgi:CO/xanthine dehydrogenase Mo-binding subunit
MSQMLNHEFSRKMFLKGGGALIVAFSAGGAAGAGTARAAESPFASNGPTDLSAVDTFISVHSDNTVSLRSGFVELGQGSPTGLLMIAAEELDVEMGQMRHVRADTNVTPNAGGTSASNTIALGGPRVRSAAATAKQALLALASAQLGVPAASLTVSKGVVSGGGRSITYGQLIGDRLFNVPMAAASVDPGVGPAKAPARYTLVGTSPPRIDIPDKVIGKYTYVHNVRVPGMLHGRIVRPRGQMVYGFGAPVVSVDEASIKHLRGARVVRKGDFVGVVADDEYVAVQAAAQLRVQWAEPPARLSGSGNMIKQMRAQDGAGGSVQSYQRITGDVETGLKSAAHVVSGSYSFSWNALQPIGADCAVAWVTADGALVYCGTSSLNGTRGQVSRATGLPTSQVRIVYYETASSFGGQQSGNLDIPKAAAVMSQLAGAPVRLQFERWDDHGWASYGPGALIDIRAGADAKGNIVGYDAASFYPQYKDFNTDTTEELALAKRPGPSVINFSSGAGFAVTPGVPGQAASLMYPGIMYSLPNERWLLKSLPLHDTWLKAQWLRSGSAPLYGFGSEQVIDELARRVGIDPVAFRVQNLSRASNRNRLLTVIDAVAKAAKWEPRVPASNLSDAKVVTGRGFAAYDSKSASATVADVQVDKSSGKIVVEHVYSATSGNLVISPGLVENQIVGAIIQMTSRTLQEQLVYSKTNVTGLDWVTYPILRFKEHPRVTSVVVQHSDLPPIGVGEPVSDSIPAAIANAFFDATGVRIHDAPMTPGRVRAALEAARA